MAISEKTLPQRSGQEKICEMVKTTGKRDDY